MMQTLTKKPLLTPDQLHGYQQKAVNFQCSHPGSMLWLDMGLGKTAITLTSIAHLLKIGFLRGVLIVAPIRVCRLVWRQEAAKWAHTNHLTFSVMLGDKDQRTRALLKQADVYLVNYENLGWLATTLAQHFIGKNRPIPFNGLVWDECFVKGTPVLMANGSEVAIDNLQVGDVVWTHLGPRRVLHTMRKSTMSLVEMRLGDGTVIRCTPNHPFLVGGRWAPAGSIRKGDRLHEASFHSEVWAGGVPDLPDNLLETQGGAIHLLEALCEHMENATTGREEGNYVWWNQSLTEASGRARDLEQGYSLVRGSSFKDKCVAQETGSFSPEWWERDRWVLGGKLTKDSPAGIIHSGIYPACDGEDKRISDTLQNRLCGPCIEDSDRGARSITQYGEGERAGRKETILPNNTWVESVIHYESGSGVDVWNIHVEEAETYFAGGVLVHNCSKMKNSSTERVRSFRRIADHFDWTTGLTGTPASNGYKDLHGQFLVVDKGQRLGKTKTEFKTRFYYKVGPYKEVAFPDTEEKIKELIGDITLEMSAADYNPLPDLMVNNVELEMDGRPREVYEKLEKEYFAQLDSGADVEVFNAASLTSKLLQVSNGNIYPVAGVPFWEALHDIKLEALEDILEEQQGNPVLCSYAFRSDAERIMARFKHLDPINLTECKSERALNHAMERWKSGTCPLMIGHAASMGHGVDGLQGSCYTIVWYGLTWSLDLYEQFNARIRRQGQGRPVICHRLMVASTIEQAQALALDDKATTQAGLRDAVKQYRLSKGA